MCDPKRNSKQKKFCFGLHLRMLFRNVIIFQKHSALIIERKRSLSILFFKFRLGISAERIVLIKKFGQHWMIGNNLILHTNALDSKCVCLCVGRKLQNILLMEKRYFTNFHRMSPDIIFVPFSSVPLNFHFVQKTHTKLNFIIGYLYFIYLLVLLTVISSRQARYLYV